MSKTHPGYERLANCLHCW